MLEEENEIIPHSQQRRIFLLNLLQLAEILLLRYKSLINEQLREGSSAFQIASLDVLVIRCFGTNVPFYF